MFSNAQHLTAVIQQCRSDDDALPFLVGYLMGDLQEGKLCNALAAWERHKDELAALEDVPEVIIELEDERFGK